MALSNHTKIAAVVFATVLIISQQGCASKPVRSPLANQSGLLGAKVGVVIKRAPEGTSLKTPEKGVSGSMGRGAAQGVPLGEVGLLCGIGFIICMPVGMALGMAGGAVYGAVAASEKGSTWDEAEVIFQAHLKELNFDHLLEERLITFAHQSGYAFQSINITKATDNNSTNYGSFSNEGIVFVLELSESTIQLQAANVMINPPRRFFTSVRAKVFRTNDGTLLDDRIVTDDKGDIRSLDEWMLNNGLAFRQQVSTAAGRTAETIVAEFFLRDPLSERTVESSAGPLTFGLMTLNALFGPAAIYPPPKAMHDPRWRTDSLQPTLRWEPFQGNDVTYDLIIWRAIGIYKGGIQPTELVYNRTGLSEASHTIEIPLQPDTLYLWTVRARYTSAGTTKMTGWVMWSMKPSQLANILTLGVTKIIPDLPPRYYFFRTKRLEERR